MILGFDQRASPVSRRSRGHRAFCSRSSILNDRRPLRCCPRNFRETCRSSPQKFVTALRRPGSTLQIRQSAAHDHRVSLRLSSTIACVKQSGEHGWSGPRATLLTSGLAPEPRTRSSKRRVNPNREQSGPHWSGNFQWL